MIRANMSRQVETRGGRGMESRSQGASGEMRSGGGSENETENDNEGENENEGGGGGSEGNRKNYSGQASGGVGPAPGGPVTAPVPGGMAVAPTPPQKGYENFNYKKKQGMGPGGGMTQPGGPDVFLPVMPVTKPKQFTVENPTTMKMKKGGMVSKNKGKGKVTTISTKGQGRTSRTKPCKIY